VSGLAHPRVVILGGGFAGLYAARTLDGEPVTVTVVDRTNHHVFQPLLYQVATGVLAPSDITVPIRWRLRRQTNATVLLAGVTDIAVDRREVCLDGDPGLLPYDYLVVATGARHAYFGHDEWEEHAPGLKTIEDAFAVRRGFLLALERAERATDAAARAAELTMVVVGGGPTGVELAGMIPTVCRRALVPEFRRIDTRAVRVVLVEAGPRLLPAFPEKLAARARRDLEALGVEVRLGTAVTGVDETGVVIGAERVAARTVFWAAGNLASPLGRQLGAPLDRQGRVLVGGDLSVPGHPEVFVAGDLAATVSGGRPVPAVAPAAVQQGRCAARNILRDLQGRPRESFRYFNKGDLATIGRNKAVGMWWDGRVRITGRVAWWFWLFVHIMYLAGFRNRASVLLQWAYAYLTYQHGVRLITGTDAQR
jgi:NADH dehydrogenase